MEAENARIPPIDHGLGSPGSRLGTGGAQRQRWALAFTRRGPVFRPRRPRLRRGVASALTARLAGRLVVGSLCSRLALISPSPCGGVDDERSRHFDLPFRVGMHSSVGFGVRHGIPERGGARHRRRDYKWQSSVQCGVGQPANAAARPSDRDNFGNVCRNWQQYCRAHLAFLDYGKIYGPDKLTIGRLAHISGMAERIAAGLRPHRETVRLDPHRNGLDRSGRCVDVVNDIVEPAG
jgi:hypothetical protein